MREGWTYKKLGEVADVSAGQGAPQGEDNYCSDGIPFIKAGNLESLINGMPEQTMQKVSDFVAKSHRLKLYKSGSVLFAKSGMSCMKGWVYTLNNDCYVVSHLAVITPHMQKTEGRYLNYYFQFNKPNTLVKDAAYPSISLKDIENISLPVPSLSEQQSIVAELDKINELISLKKAQLSDLDSLAQSIFYDMFGDPIVNEKGWKVHHMKEVCSKITDGTHDTPTRLTEGVKFITGKHIRPFYIDYDNSDYVTEEVHREIYARCNPEYDDVLYTNIGAGVANAAVNKVRYEFSMKNVALLKLNKVVLCSSYLVHYLNNSNVKNRIIESFSSGGAQIFLSLKAISKIIVPLPPLPLQQEFAKRIELIEQQKAQISSTIKDLETLLASRMQYWFD